jgi:hypothetical protein
VTVASCALVLGTWAGGCGGSSPSPAFTRDVRGIEAAVKQVNVELAGVLRRASKQTDRKLSRQLAPLATRSDQALNHLETLIPPSGLLPDFSAWRSALNRRATDLHAVIAALRAHNARAARLATQSLLLDSAAAVSAQRALDSGLASG